MQRNLFQRLNLYTILRDVLVNWWVILLALICGFNAYQVYYATCVTRTYTSSMTIAVNLSGYTTSSTSYSLTRTLSVTEAFQNVLKSDTLISVVEKQTGEPINGTFQAVQKKETNLIDLSLTSTSAGDAYRGLKNIYENYTVLTDVSFENLIISPLTMPTMPYTSSNYLLAMESAVKYGLVAALLCALGIVCLSYFRDTVKSVDDVEILLDAKLFGKIYHINKRKCHIKKTNDGLMLTNPLIDRSFYNNYSAMAVKLDNLQRTRNLKSVMITSIAENEGKTTAAINLSIALAEAGAKVIILDMDLLRPSVFKFFRGGEKKGEEDNRLAQTLNGNLSWEAAVQYDAHTGVYWMGNTSYMANSSVILSQPAFTQIIAEIKQKYDFVLIDTPPGGLAVDAEITMDKADSSILVVRQDYVPVVAINDYLANISEDKTVGILFNNVHTLAGTFFNTHRDEEYEMTVNPTERRDFHGSAR